MKKFLIFGGLGFIGTNLSIFLLNKGFDVTAYDNCISDQSPLNIKILKSYKKFKFVKGDINKKIKLNKNFDFIINLACIASPIQYQKYPLETLKASSIGILNILDYCNKYKPLKLIHSSTSEIYGDPLEHPQKENYYGNVNTVGPRSCYDEGKRFAETALFLHKKDLNISIIRIFNTYGPYMSKNDGRFVSNFITQALQNKPITIYGNGNQTRSICFIDDLIKGIFKTCNKNIFGPFNLGNPKEYRVIDLAH
ncbi:GDP-mannose 4,6-dehydratase, partial [Alphaproteobacteria bacterium]|nr:GDP-mannose 4,6-dehydratase [Alphaproteobacteria bacterium]